jgi:hypothetical protein
VGRLQARTANGLVTSVPLGRTSVRYVSQTTQNQSLAGSGRECGRVRDALRVTSPGARQLRILRRQNETTFGAPLGRRHIRLTTLLNWSRSVRPGCATERKAFACGEYLNAAPVGHAEATWRSRDRCECTSSSR